MRNLIVAIALVVTLLWLFVSKVFVSVEEYDKSVIGEEATVNIKSKARINLDSKKLFTLLGVEYKEEIIEVDKPVIHSFDVDIEIVVIYTSETKQKLRISKQVDEIKTQVDMEVGDKLYGYELTAINPSSAVLDNGEEKIVLEVFKVATISVSDSPKETLETS